MQNKNSIIGDRFMEENEIEIIGSKNIPASHIKAMALKKTRKKQRIIWSVSLAVLLIIGGILFLTRHRHDYVTEITAPTCTAQGYTTYTCSCGESYIDDTVKKLDHAYQSVVTAPTCTEQGYTTHTCACGESYVATIEKLGHTPGAEATCTTAQNCTVCNAELKAVLGHMPEWEIVTEATKTEDGFKVQKCSGCGEKFAEEVIPATVSLGLKFTFNGDGTCTVRGIGTCTDTDIVIPSTYNGMRVTSIGSSAFYNCTKLTSVTIPDSVTSIGERAFSDCSGLTSVTIPDSVTSIGYLAFFGCSGLTSVTIPDSVTSIGDYAFYKCTSLTSITVGSNHPNYASVDGVLFNKAKTELICYPAGKTGSYTIPDSVTSIGDSAFLGCTGLTSVTIGNSVTSIGERAFYGCSKLTSVTIGDSVTSIGNYAFYG